jgi:hypothetical protein
MPDINLTLSTEQVRALLQISQNQLFRLRFLDPKMPGYKARPGEVEDAASAIKVLEAALKTPAADTGGWSSPTPRPAVHPVR